MCSSCFSEFRQNFSKPADRLNLKNSNLITSHKFHSVICSELIHNHKSLAKFNFSISLFKSMRQLNIVSFTSSSTTFKSTSTISKFSFYSIAMMKASMTCSSSFSSISSQSSIFSSKIYMIMNNLFVMFVKREKQFRRSLNIIHKQMRSSRFSRARMFDQTQIISCFKFTSQLFNSLKFVVFSSCFCSTFRICFSVNRAADIPQYQNIAIDTPNQRFKTSEM